MRLSIPRRRPSTRRLSLKTILLPAQTQAHSHINSATQHRVAARKRGE
jgi:hypothetical protein